MSDLQSTSVDCLACSARAVGAGASKEFKVNSVSKVKDGEDGIKSGMSLKIWVRKSY
jgi:hypothetical protein